MSVAADIAIHRPFD